MLARHHGICLDFFLAILFFYTLDMNPTLILITELWLGRSQKRMLGRAEDLKGGHSFFTSFEGGELKLSAGFRSGVSIFSQNF